MESAAASIPVIDRNATGLGAERAANIRIGPINSERLVNSGDNPERAPTPMDDSDVIMDDPGPVAQSPSSDVVVLDSDGEMPVLPQRLARPAATGPSVPSQSGQVQGRRTNGTGKFVSSTGISVAAASATLPVYHRRNAEGRGSAQTKGSQGGKGEIGGRSMGSGSGAQRRETGKGRAVTTISLDQANGGSRFTLVTPPPDDGPHDSTGPDAKPLQHIMDGPRQLLAIYEIPWRDPLPGMRGRDNTNIKSPTKPLPDRLKGLYCRRPRKPLPDEDVSADPIDIEAMAKYLLSYDQGFFGEFYEDYRDGYKREQWDVWFRKHEMTIRQSGIDLLKISDFIWDRERQTRRYLPLANYLQPTWSEELTLTLTPFEEEILAKEWNPVKDLDYVEDESFCNIFARRANGFLDTQSLIQVGHHMRPRWGFRYAKRGPGSETIKRRTARQWEHRFRTSSRVGELIGEEGDDYEFSSNDEKDCNCGDVHP